MARKVKQIIPLELNEEKPNLIEDKIVYEIGIHALPGTVFKINGGEFVMNNTGNFSLNCEEHPITSLELTSDPSGLYSIIIDIIYEEVVAK